MKNDITTPVPTHHWQIETSFSCIESCERFYNWLRHEFHFFQQVQDSLLTFYFPNGSVEFSTEKKLGANIISKIRIESKCKNVGSKIKNRLSDFLTHFERYTNQSNNVY